MNYLTLNKSGQNPAKTEQSQVLWLSLILAGLLITSVLGHFIIF